jgi:hypothetical protein
MYLKQIKEKFINFDDFIYLGYYRDKIKKKTIIKLQCKKCKSIIEKEQYDFLNNNKTLFCFNCKCVKKAQPLNYDDIIRKFEENGCEDLKINKYKISGICKCGQKFEKNIYRLKYYICSKCSLNNRKFHNSYKYDDVYKWFIDNGLTPLFDKYENANKNLKYKCICGEISEIRYSRRFEHDENWKPMCKKCAMKLKTSNINHWNWKGGCKYSGNTTWSKKVKKIYNNVCCISGTSDNLDAHHLIAISNKVVDDCELNDISNGVCINHDLHVEFHKKYDKFTGTCTKEQFDDFFFIKTNSTFDDYIDILKQTK